MKNGVYIYTQYVYIVYGKNTDEHPHPRFHPRFTQSTCSAKPMIRRQVTWRHCQLQLCFLPGLRGSNFPSSDMGSFWKIAEELNENHGIVRFFLLFGDPSRHPRVNMCSNHDFLNYFLCLIACSSEDHSYRCVWKWGMPSKWRIGHDPSTCASFCMSGM